VARSFRGSGDSFQDPGGTFGILFVLLDTLIRVSELVGLDAEEVDIDENVILVMGKGRKERQVPFGTGTARPCAATEARWRISEGALSSPARAGE